MTAVSKTHLPIVLIETDRLRRHEEHVPSNADHVRGQIMSAGTWTTPIVVEWKDLIVMDGHHRLSVARQAGLTFVPCILADYHTIQVESRRPDIVVTPDEIRRRALSGLLYPPKTTRHHIPSNWVACCSVPLSVLGGFMPTMPMAERFATSTPGYEQ